MVLVTLKGGRLMDGELDGEGNRILPNGTTETGIFKNSLLNGQGKIMHANGTIEEGLFEDGVLVDK